MYVHFVFLLEDCVCWLYKKSGAGEETNTTDMAVTLGIVDAATRPTYVRMRKYALDITRDVEMTMSNPGDLLEIIDTARVADILSQIVSQMNLSRLECMYFYLLPLRIFSKGCKFSYDRVLFLHEKVKEIRGELLSRGMSELDIPQ